MGDWLALGEAAAAAMEERTPGNIETALRRFQPLIAKHNLTNRAGQPIEELTFQTLSSGLFIALLRAIQRAMTGAGIPPQKARRERSRGRSSPDSQRHRATTSGD